MKSLKELYRIGHGPSSSHTMAPPRALRVFALEYPNAMLYRVTLFGSLAATGKGHMTDVAMKNAVNNNPLEIIWKPNEELPKHANGMKFEAIDESNNLLGTKEDYSTGGGALYSDGESGEIYPLTTISEILSSCENNGDTFWEFVEQCEGKDIWDFLEQVWSKMSTSIENGLNAKGKLPGSLELPRKAHAFYRKSNILADNFKEDALIAAYAYAVTEENASGGEVVTAPTCGASGVLPAVLFFLKNKMNFSKMDILRALATAGLFGNIVKTNGSIAGAQVGCQGEVGTACAMAAAAAAQLIGGSPRQIEYAAEMGLEHHFGLTCDPVDGLVQIPCIERNAHAALRALDCSHFAILSDGMHRISFDDAVSVLLETGQNLSTLFKETSMGGLARIYKKHICKS